MTYINQILDFIATFTNGGQDKENTVLAISLPLYVITIGLEMLFSHLEGRNFYSIKETLTNVYLTTLNMLCDLGMRILVAVFCLGFAYEHRIFSFEKNAMYWLGLVLAIDFMYYWLHRADHYCRVFWAVHVTHHSSTHYNITTGFRSSVFEPMYRFLFYMPIAFLGFSVLDIIFIHSALQIYGVFVHTQYVKRLPKFLEFFLVSPAHHRVHHGSNIEYLDKNMAMTFIIWDRMFGTFQDELEEIPVVYGLTTNPEDRGPVNIVFHEWIIIWKDVTQKGLTLKQRLGYLFQPPGWSHDGSRMTSVQLRKAKYGEE
jgi:sterol desaturase/sphingolipid hydroxylase (fatty acid hydroxylase superfamily)